MASQALLIQPSLLLTPISRYNSARSNFRVSVYSGNLGSKISSRTALSYSATLPDFPTTIEKSNVSAIASADAPPHSSCTGSTRTLTTLFALALALPSFFVKLLEKIPLPIPSAEQLAAIRNLQGCHLSTSVGPLFFAAVRDRPTGRLNTPLTVVAAGLSKWLDIYSGVLVIRVLLSWFPNIPWDRQPLSAIRDLCDPYLNLFRNIIPPVFNTLDISPIFAFTVLGMLGSILNSTKSM